MKINNSLIIRVLIVLSGVFLSSCSSMLYTTIDVLRPAKVSFPEDIDNLLIVNNTVAQPSTYGHKTESFNAKPKSVTIDTDSLVYFALASFSESVSEREFFNSVDVIYESQNESNDFYSVALPSSGKLSSLSKQYGANAIVSLNRMIVNSTLGEFYNEEEASFIAYIEAQYEYNWTISFPEKNHIFSLVTKDTVYWEIENYSRNNALKSLPDRKIALIDGAIISGRKAVNQFIPYWEREDRYFFNLSDKTFKTGLDSIYVKNWESAITKWETLIKSNTGPNKKAKLLHNLSVLYEITGDIKKAYEYSNASLETMLESLLFNYNEYLLISEQNEVLQKRLKDVDLLKKQLGEN
ncbi:MAG: hypothetical protein BGO29_16190 [Bacteroidales bacterium 36-12]|jgi:hypothetical protein|nr:MAG: hypothetical protein BGO29_16190 [Bacteroidales bacterium 36-12]